MTESPLKTELGFFDAHAPEYKKHHMGKFVLIRGETLVGAFDTVEAAYREGVSRFGNVPMLIKQVVDADRAESLPALMHGVLRALP